MANGTMPTPNLLTDPGFLYWAPLGSALPTNTVVGSVFTDTWPVAWLKLGMTDAGSTWSTALTVEDVDAAESLDPIAKRTTARAASMSTALLDITAANLARVLNTAASVVSGSGATLLTKVDPPALGNEVRCMVGFESVDSTVRVVGYQAINSGDISIAMQKAPAKATLPVTFDFEKPSATQPFTWWTAGANRA